jgi:catechol 2,3-dioxygenase-like lactoylglutathione lyase family enzyme
MSRTTYLLSIALAICGLAAQAQTGTPLLAGIAHVAIRVSDLNRSRNFYQKLGFEEAFTLTKDGVVTESFLKVSDQQFIEMYPQQQPSQPIGFMHVCFEGADLEALNREYLARGLSPTPVKRAGAGNLLFTMEGPEKQNIEYTQYMPGSLHSDGDVRHRQGLSPANRPAGSGLRSCSGSRLSNLEDERVGLAFPVIFLLWFSVVWAEWALSRGVRRRSAGLFRPFKHSGVAQKQQQPATTSIDPFEL